MCPLCGCTLSCCFTLSPLQGPRYTRVITNTNVIDNVCRARNLVGAQVMMPLFHVPEVEVQLKGESPQFRGVWQARHCAEPVSFTPLPSEQCLS